MHTEAWSNMSRSPICENWTPRKLKISRCTVWHMISQLHKRIALIYTGWKYDCIVFCPDCNELPNLATNFFPLLLPLESLVDVLLLFICGLHDKPSSSFSLRLVIEPLLSVTLSGVTSVDSLVESISVISVVVVTPAATRGMVEYPVVMSSLLVWLGCGSWSMLCCSWRCFFKWLDVEAVAYKLFMASFPYLLWQFCCSDEVPLPHPVLDRAVLTPSPPLSATAGCFEGIKVLGADLCALCYLKLYWLILPIMVMLLEQVGVEFIVDFCCKGRSGVLDCLALDDVSSQHCLNSSVPFKCPTN